jgi:hypothetical protein
VYDTMCLARMLGSLLLAWAFDSGGFGAKMAKFKSSNIIPRFRHEATGDPCTTLFIGSNINIPSGSCYCPKFRAIGPLGVARTTSRSRVSIQSAVVPVAHLRALVRVFFRWFQKTLRGTYICTGTWLGKLVHLVV